MKKLIKIIPLLIFAASCGGGTETEQDEPQDFELLIVEMQNYSVNTEYAAAVKGSQDIKIIPKVEGYLEGVFVKEGAQVKEGQRLFSIDNSTYRAAVQSAEANVEMMSAALSKAQLEYDGKKSLHEKQIVSDHELALAESDLKIAKANLSAAKAALNSAQCDLSFTEIRSPSDGVVGRIPYRKGDLVSPNIQDGLTIVADNRVMRVYFSMSEKSIMDYISKYKSMKNAVEKMPEIQLQLSNNEIYPLKGKIESISGIVDSKTGAVSVCALFNNPDEMLLSGSTGKVLMPNFIENCIIIPQESTYEIQDKVFVMKVTDGKAVATMITIENNNDGKHYAVLSGLSAGDTIIAKGAGFVKEGTEINLEEYDH